MKFAMNFRYDNYLQSDIDEIILNWKGTERQLVSLPQFIKVNHLHDITISIPTSDSLTPVEVDLISSLCKQYPNFKVRFDKLSREDLLTIEEKEIRFYINKMCGDPQMVQAMLMLGVTDIYISGCLAFNLERVHKAVSFLDEEDNYIHTVNIRVIPNLVQTVEGLPDYKGFFLRPEELEYYSQWIDVFELYTPIEDDKTPAVTLRAYKFDKSWYGDLTEIIFGLQTTIDGKRLSKVWGESRANCNKRCYLGSNCRICDLFIEQIKYLEELDIISGG